MNENQRPLWIIIFAILLASIAIRSNGQETNGQDTQSHRNAETQSSDDASAYTEMQIGERIVMVKRASAESDTAAASTPAIPSGRQTARSQRPKSALVSAEIAQFDSDSDPDGWLAKVMLIGNDDCVVTVRRATARFELMPRLPTHDFTGYVDANLKPIVWNSPLQFAADGIATVRLPLRNPIAPLTGWPATSHPAVGDAGGFHASRRGIIRHTSPAFESPTALTDRHDRASARSAIGMASFGQLRVRVSVPGEGVFDAVTPITLRPAVLVDTRWPYQ
ncbi:hypothetical protein Mal15_37700 [Stieleria maiorica]|uniref:Uncharacterized protein n=1 Tax=Stieleria maiorica TaxID=2795974 RepID=A0A5B9MJ82_9BACT|nr:hypothetical protein [Stieleria maiorica]QEF99704.1 hypothetical protein Mal15_37700 [Stieleria maiorica]